TVTKDQDTSRLSKPRYIEAKEKPSKELENATFVAGVGLPIVFILLLALGAHVTIPLIIGGLALIGIGYLTYRLVNDNLVTRKKIAKDEDAKPKQLSSPSLPSRFCHSASAFFSRLNPLNKKLEEKPVKNNDEDSAPSLN
ncbi:MAG: hypothetical protein K2Q33_06170, partial [Gammaproteobacteria bacterium]|nr:hypothetical protein [Gammaproteobacteria bacterium]